MAHIYVDDGAPESSDYASNYIYFDPSDPESLKEALEKARVKSQNRIVVLGYNEGRKKNESLSNL